MSSRKRPASRGAATLAVVAALGLCLGAVAPQASYARGETRSFATGIADVYSNEAAAFTHVRDTGSIFTLSPLRWNAIAPSRLPASWNPEDPNDPNYEWGFFDEWVTRAVKAGLTPVLDVRGAPAWAQHCTGTGEAICEPDPAALAAFTKAAVRRYSGRVDGLPKVRYWQGLNEPNLSLFFQPQFEGGKPVSAQLYRALINTFYGAVKSVEPSDLVLAAGLGPIAVPGYTIGPMQFARELLCMTGGNLNPRPVKGNCGGGVDFDIFDIHPYTTGGPTHEGARNDVEMGDLGKLQTLLRAADRAGRINGSYRHTPLWITEFGWDSKPPDPGGLPMKIEKQWIAEALYEAWRARVQTFMWYSLDDFPPEPGVPFSESLQTGLYFWAPRAADEQPKEIMYAFRFPFVAIRHRRSLDLWGRTPHGRRGKVAIQLLQGGRWRLALVLRAGSGGVFHGPLATEYGEGGRGYARAVFRGNPSVPFPMRRVGDFPQPPFG